MSALTASTFSQRWHSKLLAAVVVSLGRCLPLALGSGVLWVSLVLGDAHFAHSDPVARLFDEGMTLSQSSRIAEGQVPYRDFWMIYGPGHYYVIAGLFKVFGATIAVERAWDLMARIGCTLLVFTYCRTFCTYGKALIPYGVTVLWLATANFYGYVMFPVLFLMLSAALCMRLALQHGRPLLWLGTGLLIGVLGTFRHDLGFMMCCGAVGIACVAAIRTRRSELPTSPIHLRSLSWLLTGIALTGAPPYAYVIATAGWHEFVYTFVIYPLTLFKHAHSLPYPNVLELIAEAMRGELTWAAAGYRALFQIMPLYAPIAAYVGALGLVGYWFTRGKQRPFAESTVPLWPIILVGLVLLNQALNRADRIHVVPTTVATIVVTTWLIQSAIRCQETRVMKAVMAGIALVYPSYVLEPVQVIRGIVTTHISTPCGDSMVDQRRACGFIYEDQRAALEYVDERAEADEPVYVGVTRHDRLFAHDILSSFLLGRPPATRYDDLLSGQVRTREVQEAISNDLSERGVRFVVLFSGFVDIIEPNESSRSSGVTILDEAIRDNYREVFRSGRYQVLERREA